MASRRVAAGFSLGFTVCGGPDLKIVEKPDNSPIADQES